PGRAGGGRERRADGRAEGPSGRPGGAGGSEAARSWSRGGAEAGEPEGALPGSPRAPPQLCLLCTCSEPHRGHGLWDDDVVQLFHARGGPAAAGGCGPAEGSRAASADPRAGGEDQAGAPAERRGATLAVLAVGTEFWVELNTYKTNGSAVCEAAHLGLWKMCTKRLWQADLPEGRDTCGPAELPGEVNLAAAVIAVLGLAVMALGCLCIIMVLSKGAEFLLRVGAVCFGLSGLLLLVSLEVFRHAVQALLQRVSDENPPAPALTYEYSWSLGCGVGASLVLLLGAGCFFLLTLPTWPWGSLCPKQGPRDT
uniref:Voltage-dependent calcium channel gamma-6 subunit n=1 Tax=Canis lupus familiaris TaxID=9615 RepID=A0A8C0PW60_CANLF